MWHPQKSEGFWLVYSAKWNCWDDCQRWLIKCINLNYGGKKIKKKKPLFPPQVAPGQMGLPLCWKLLETWYLVWWGIGDRNQETHQTQYIALPLLWSFLQDQAKSRAISLRDHSTSSGCSTGASVGWLEHYFFRLSKERHPGDHGTQLDHALKPGDQALQPSFSG